MVSKAKEKKKKRNTKDESILDLDNEIIIGIKTLPEPKPPKKKKTKKAPNKNKKQKKYQEPEDINIPTINIEKKKNKKKNTKAKNKNNYKDEKDYKNNYKYEDDYKNNHKSKGNYKNNYKSKGNTSNNKKKSIPPKRRRTYRIIKWTSLILLLLGGTIYFLLSPFFNIKEITTSGNEKISSEELISLSGIKLEQNTFQIQNSKVQEAIKQNAYIDTVKLKRTLPSSIQIIVTERTPTFMLNFANAYVYMNNQGYLLEISQTKLNLPIITGFLTKEEELHEGSRLCLEDLERLDQTLQIMKSAQSNGLGDKITKINIADKQNYVLELTSEKKTVYLGDTSNLSTKMLYIISIIEENKKTEGEIFVNTDLSNKGAIFRKKV